MTILDLKSLPDISQNGDFILLLLLLYFEEKEKSGKRTFWAPERRVTKCGGQNQPPGPGRRFKVPLFFVFLSDK